MHTILIVLLTPELKHGQYLPVHTFICATILSILLNTVIAFLFINYFWD